MKKSLLTLALASAALLGKSQFTQDDLIYYVGSGSDTAVLVIDFLDGTADSSYAWGFLFDEATTTTGGDMLNAIATAEDQMTVDAGAFLNAITYNDHDGPSGGPDFYWGTWSKTAETDWAANSGLGEELSNGDWFGCSYTDFDPSIAPGEPIAAYASSAFTWSDIQYKVGEGSDSAIFVVDFVEATYGEAVSYAWAYYFDGTTDGATMLADIDEADTNLIIDAGTFLNDIEYNGLVGVGGEPHYWGTFSGTNLTDWTLNTGLSTTIENGDWFGCSYDAWQPRRPFYPIAAYDAESFTFDSFVAEPVGSGENSVVMVIDFNEWLPGRSYAYQVAFDTETITAQDVMEILNDAAYSGVFFEISGAFLTTIEYFGEPGEGIGGMPYYWSTWSADNVSGWITNAGISEVLEDGDWFGCSYTAFSPATPPSEPIESDYVSGIAENSIEFQLYPNPASSRVVVEVATSAQLQITDLRGRVVVNKTIVSGTNQIEISDLATGVYTVNIESEGVVSTQRLVKK